MGRRLPLRGLAFALAVALLAALQLALGVGLFVEITFVSRHDAPLTVLLAGRSPLQQGRPIA